MQFITNNKINNDSFQLSKEQIAALKKNIVSPLPISLSRPRKNSPVPYLKGRRSAFAKMTQPPSPTSLIMTQRNSFPKSSQIQ